MANEFHTRRFVEFSDTDMAGIAHFSAFFRYMEAAEHALLRSLGMSVYTPLPDGAKLSFPRVNASCDYQSPARCEDELDIRVTVQRLGEKSVTYGFHITLDGRPVATGKMTSVCCRLEEGSAPKSQPIPSEIADKLREYLETPST